MVVVAVLEMDISIHALREEGDNNERHFNQIPQIFLSTPSARRATAQPDATDCQSNISIHALREEGDPRSIMRLQVRYNFYPRPPRGGRLAFAIPMSTPAIFLSTPSARRATLYNSDRPECHVFLSTPSARRATRPTPHRRIKQIFLSTPSARRATR